MTINKDYTPIETYLINFTRSIENMPEVFPERLEKKCGTASLKMINDGSRRSELFDSSTVIRQNFELSYRTAGNDSAIRAKAFGILEQFGDILEKTTDMDLGEGRDFIKAFRTDFPALSVRCTGGEEEYCVRYQLIYIQKA